MAEKFNIEVIKVLDYGNISCNWKAGKMMRQGTNLCIPSVLKSETMAFQAYNTWLCHSTFFKVALQFQTSIREIN